jgi:kynureninase
MPESPEAIVSAIRRRADAANQGAAVLARAVHRRHRDAGARALRDARANNVFSVVDGAQACGLIDVQLTTLGCDAYATSFHKWLNGAYGTGALYCAPMHERACGR